MSDIKDFKIKDGVLYDYTGDDTEIVIPEGVKIVRNQCLSKAKRINYSSTVKQIIGYQFGERFDELETVILNEGLETIGEYAFHSSKKLAEIDIPNTVKFIGKCAFLDAGLKNISVPNQNCAIDGYAFAYCDNLEEVTLPVVAHVKGPYYPQDVFYRSKNLKRVYITTKSKDVEGSCESLIIKSKKTFEYSKLEFIDAPYLDISEIKFKKVEAILGFIKRKNEGFIFDNDIESKYIKYINSQQKRLVEPAIINKDLLLFMISQKILKLENIDAYVDFASKNNYVDTLSQLLEYKNSFGVSFDSVFEDLEKPLKIVDPNSVAEMKKIWTFSKTKDKQIIIKGYKGNDVDVVVPNMIGKDKVIAISSAAFSPLQKRVSNEIAESRRKIESIVIPDGVEYLGCLVFNGCESLKKIEMPSTVRYFTSHKDDKYEYYDFAYKTSYLGDCSNLTEIVISEDNKELVYKDQMLINKNTVLYVHPKKAGECVLDENITDIYGAAFRGSEITFIAIPSSEMIGPYAFDNCQQLKKVELPNNVFTIGSNAFSNCVQLEEVINLDKARMIGEKAFYNCERLKCIDVQNAVDIEYSAFKNCVGLEKINISNVKYLGTGAFSNCGISSVIITKHNQGIKEKLFSNCCNLERVVYEAGEHRMSYHMFAFCENLKEFHCLEKTIIDEFSTPFYASKNVTIYAPAGSNAEQYAKKHKIPFIAE